MINTIIEAISTALDKTFGEGYEIYMEEIKQGLQEPCFFIQCLHPTTSLFLGKRYFKENPFCIQYFPLTEKKQRECYEVAERMIGCLERIFIKKDCYRGTNIYYEIIDGVLNFFVNYNFFVSRIEMETPMEQIESQIGAKEGKEIENEKNY